MKIFSKGEIARPEIDDRGDEKVLSGCVSEPMEELQLFEYGGDRYFVTEAHQIRSGNFLINSWSIKASSPQPGKSKR